MLTAAAGFCKVLAACSGSEWRDDDPTSYRQPCKAKQAPACRSWKVLGPDAPFKDADLRMRGHAGAISGPCLVAHGTWTAWDSRNLEAMRGLGYDYGVKLQDQPANAT